MQACWPTASGADQPEQPFGTGVPSRDHAIKPGCEDRKLARAFDHGAVVSLAPAQSGHLGLKGCNAARLRVALLSCCSSSARWIAHILLSGAATRVRPRKRPVASARFVQAFSFAGAGNKGFTSAPHHLGPTLDRARLTGDDLPCMSVEDADHLVDPEAPKPASVDGAAGERGAGCRVQGAENALRMAHRAAKATAAS